MDYVSLSEHEARCCAAALVTLVGLKRGQEERVVQALSQGLSRSSAVSGEHQGRRWSGQLVASGAVPELQILAGAGRGLAAVANARLRQITLLAALGTPGPRSRLSGLAGRAAA